MVFLWILVEHVKLSQFQILHLLGKSGFIQFQLPGFPSSVSTPVHGLGGRKKPRLLDRLWYGSPCFAIPRR